MLGELFTAQKEPGVFRRWFRDEYFELIVWYDLETYSIQGFQLCYDVSRDERTLTWYRGQGFSHDAVDDGKGPMRHPSSPTLVADGLFRAGDIAERFIEACAGIDRAIARLVITKINEYGDLRLDLEGIFASLDERVFRAAAQVYRKEPAPGEEAPAAPAEAAAPGKDAGDAPPARPGAAAPERPSLASLLRGLAARIMSSSRGPVIESVQTKKEDSDELMKNARMLAKKMAKKKR